MSDLLNNVTSSSFDLKSHLIQYKSKVTPTKTPAPIKKVKSKSSQISSQEESESSLDLDIFETKKYHEISTAGNKTYFSGLEEDSSDEEQQNADRIRNLRQKKKRISIKITNDAVSLTNNTSRRKSFADKTYNNASFDLSDNFEEEENKIKKRRKLAKKNEDSDTIPLLANVPVPIARRSILQKSYLSDSSSVTLEGGTENVKKSYKRKSVQFDLESEMRELKKITHHLNSENDSPTKELNSVNEATSPHTSPRSNSIHVMGELKKVTPSRLSTDSENDSPTKELNSVNEATSPRRSPRSNSSRSPRSNSIHVMGELKKVSPSRLITDSENDSPAKELNSVAEATSPRRSLRSNSINEVPESVDKDLTTVEKQSSISPRQTPQKNRSLQKLSESNVLSSARRSLRYSKYNTESLRGSPMQNSILINNDYLERNQTPILEPPELFVNSPSSDKKRTRLSEKENNSLDNSYLSFGTGIDENSINIDKRKGKKIERKKSVDLNVKSIFENIKNSQQRNESPKRGSPLKELEDKLISSAQKSRKLKDSSEMNQQQNTIDSTLSNKTYESIDFESQTSSKISAALFGKRRSNQFHLGDIASSIPSQISLPVPLDINSPYKSGIINSHTNESNGSSDDLATPLVTLKNRFLNEENDNETDYADINNEETLPMQSLSRTPTKEKPSPKNSSLNSTSKSASITKSNRSREIANSPPKDTDTSSDETTIFPGTEYDDANDASPHKENTSENESPIIFNFSRKNLQSKSLSKIEEPNDTTPINKTKSFSKSKLVRRSIQNSSSSNRNSSAIGGASSIMDLNQITTVTSFRNSKSSMTPKAHSSGPKLSATPSSSKPSATPSGSKPSATPSGSKPSMTPSGSKPSVTPSGSKPSATPNDPKPSGSGVKTLTQLSMKDFLQRLKDKNLPVTEKPKSRSFDEIVAKSKSYPAVVAKKSPLKRNKKKDTKRPCVYYPLVKKHMIHNVPLKIKKDALEALEPIVDKFFHQVLTDLTVCLKNKKNIQLNDVYLLMKNLKLVSSECEMEAKMQEMLPIDVYSSAVPMLGAFGKTNMD